MGGGGAGGGAGNASAGSRGSSAGSGGGAAGSGTAGTGGSAAGAGGSAAGAGGSAGGAAGSTAGAGGSAAGAANTFHVRPLNETTATWAGNAIEASVRIADWGTGIGDSPLCLAVPDASRAGATGSGAVPAGSRFDLTCNWTLTMDQRCDCRPDLAPGCTPDSIGARFAQQAIFVELTSSGFPILFPSSSVATTFSFGTP